MAEVVALIGSALNVATFVNDGIKRARALYQASDQFKALQANPTFGVILSS